MQTNPKVMMRNIFFPHLLKMRISRPLTPKKLTAKLTAKRSDRQLHKETNQDNYFCVHQAQERGEGYRGSREGPQEKTR